MKWTFRVCPWDEWFSGKQFCWRSGYGAKVGRMLTILVGPFYLKIWRGAGKKYLTSTERQNERLNTNECSRIRKRVP